MMRPIFNLCSQRKPSEKKRLPSHQHDEHHSRFVMPTLSVACVNSTSSPAKIIRSCYPLACYTSQAYYRDLVQIYSLTCLPSVLIANNCRRRGTLAVCWSPLRTSGAMYCGVPEGSSTVRSLSACSANPKSATYRALETEERNSRQKEWKAREANLDIRRALRLDLSCHIRVKEKLGQNNHAP